MKQIVLDKVHWRHRYSHGGSLRNLRAGRGSRPLSRRDPIHLVLKANRSVIQRGFRSYQRFFLIHDLLKKYSKKFFIKIEQISVQGDHIHLLIRISNRSNAQSFLRVFPGQIAQEFQRKELIVTDTPKGARNERNSKSCGQEKDKKQARKHAREPRKQKLWKYRPFTRVVKGYRAYQTVKNYIRLNEKEALGEIPYRKQRLKGLLREEWQALWS